MNIVEKFRKFAGAAALGTMLSGVMLFSAVPQARAENERQEEHIKCNRRVEKAEWRLQDAVRHHGRGSRQALARRHELNNQRERCWNEYHGWWNGHEHRWHTDRDWDRDRD
ncbi:MAG: hypothetical protein NVS1B11_24130 [Terriglobales bacterium]